MLATLISIPVIGFLAILQSAVVSRMPLLHGTADLILLVLIAWALQEPVKTSWQWSVAGGLMIGISSILPLMVPVIAYLAITTVVNLVKRQIWENQIIAMFAMTFLGSIISQGFFALVASIRGASLPFFDTLRLIMLPSLLLNILLAAPVYAVMKDLAEWVHPDEIKA